MKWGTGGINIDECRVGTELMKETKSDGTFKSSNNSMSGYNTGRFPANFIWSCNEDEYELKDGVNEDDLRKLEKWFENETA